eukprot:IDg10811t1
MATRDAELAWARNEGCVRTLYYPWTRFASTVKSAMKRKAEWAEGIEG